MASEESKFYLNHGSAASLYRFVIISFLCFAALLIYEQSGVTIASAVIFAFIAGCARILIPPLRNSKKPMYTIADSGITQNKYPFLPKEIPWSHVSSITYPAMLLLGGKGAVSLDMQSGVFMSRPFVISLADIDDPPALLRALNGFKPFGYDQAEGELYFQHFDKERTLYITILYICFAISFLGISLFEMPYIMLENNRYSTFWGVLYVAFLFLSTALSIFVYKDIKKRKTLVKAIVFFWFIIGLGPFLAEENAYYNLQGLMAEQRGDFDAAEFYLRKAIQIHPQGYSYHETLGKALFQKGQFAGCIEQFTYLLENNKQLTAYYKAYYHLWIGKALLRLNRIDEARIELEKVRAAAIEDFKAELATLPGG